jgi:hypothetical protein
MTRKQYITLARIDRNEMSNRYNIQTSPTQSLAPPTKLATLLLTFT